MLRKVEKCWVWNVKKKWELWSVEECWDMWISVEKLKESQKTLKKMGCQTRSYIENHQETLKETLRLDTFFENLRHFEKSRKTLRILKKKNDDNNHSSTPL